MKKAKKLAALFLAMVMAFSVMAVTAAAYGEDEHVHTGECCEESVEPRKPGYYCPKCGSDASCYLTGYNKLHRPIYMWECPQCGTFEMTM